jgi:hypothetical protein
MIPAHARRRQNAGDDPMAKVDGEKAARAAGILCRYMRARHRFADKVERPLSPAELSALIAGGKEEFDEIYVEPEASPPIVLDGKADEFFTAIIKKDYGAMSGWDPQLLAAWRYYVLRDGPLPRTPKAAATARPAGNA